MKIRLHRLNGYVLFPKFEKNVKKSLFLVIKFTYTCRFRKKIVDLH